MLIIAIIFLIILAACGNKISSRNKKIEENDNDPYSMTKSDKWYKSQLENN